MSGVPEDTRRAAAIVQSLLDIIEGDDAEWLNMATLDEQRATIERAKVWLAAAGTTSGEEPV